MESGAKPVIPPTYLHLRPNFCKGGCMERPFVAENAKERERLRSLVERLTDKEQSLPLGNG
jgi:hypothetical protein